MEDKFLNNFIYGTVLVQLILRQFMKVMMVSILSFQKMMAFGVEEFTSQLTLHIRVEILNGLVTHTKFLMDINYLMEARCPMAPK
jgi:hypothetical protein